LKTDEKECNMSKSARAKQIADKNNFINAEVKAIEIAKWLAGERMKKDPGNDFVSQWIQNKAKKYRQKWKESKCQYCSIEKCRYKNTSKCSKFKPVNTL